MKKKKGKDGDKVKRVKTEEERLQETDIIRRQINDLGLGEGNLDIKTFFSELDNFVRSGYSWSGKIQLHGYNRVIDAKLTMNPNIISSVALLYDKDV